MTKSETNAKIGNSVRIIVEVRREVAAKIEAGAVKINGWISECREREMGKHIEIVNRLSGLNLYK